MRITNEMLTNQLLAEIQGLDTQQSQLQGEVSSGLAVTQPSDNPSAFGQVVQYESQDRQLSEYSQNSGQALNLANESYSGLQSLQSIYDRVTQLGTLGLTTSGAQSQQAYASELDQLISQTVSVANTEVGGQYIYGGTAVDTPPYTAATDSSGSVTGVTYVGNTNQLNIPIGEGETVAPGTTGATNQGIAALINNMVSLRDALNSGDTTAINTANTNLASGEDVITGAVAENGAVQARIQSDQTQQTSESTEINSLISGASDADLSTTMVKLNATQLAYQAALQSSASVMHLSILNYIELS